MDIIIYAALALVVIIGLLFAFGKKSPEDATELPKTKDADRLDAARPSPAPREPEPKKKEEKRGAKEKAPPEEAPAKESARSAESDDSDQEADRSSFDESEAIEEPPVEKAEPPPPPSSRPKSLPAPERPSEVEALREGLALSRQSTGFFGKLKALFTGKAEISPEIADRIEEVLLSSDVGVTTTTTILERIREGLSKGELKDEAQVWRALRQHAKDILTFEGATPGLAITQKPTVVLMVGVNGAGKTTTIGKLATQLQAEGKTCVLAAGDTFRAAAVQQLVVWGERVGCEVVRGKDGADPGSVVFDAIKRAQEIGADVVLADTAGRLHTKRNLMSEMEKVVRTAGKALESAPHETLLVIDSTNGQNALAQAKEFKERLNLTGVVLTKLDGTAKGGVVLGIADTLKLAVRFVGLGERPDDLHAFSADDFVQALLGRDGDS